MPAKKESKMMRAITHSEVQSLAGDGVRVVEGLAGDGRLFMERVARKQPAKTPTSQRLTTNNSESMSDHFDSPNVRESCARLVAECFVAKLVLTGGLDE